MTDEMILRMADETVQILSKAPWHLDCKHLLPTYNAMLVAARDNHPDDSFLGALVPINPNNGDVNAPILTVLFAQLRMALESLAGANGSRGEEIRALSVEH
ncbi:MAG: hypothetical protein KY468_01690 [Armatimonadetes bacterium]|nr:hypothetical protein [Armatimonadota bacterium]